MNHQTWDSHWYEHRLATWKQVCVFNIFFLKTCFQKLLMNMKFEYFLKVGVHLLRINQKWVFMKSPPFFFVKVRPNTENIRRVLLTAFLNRTLNQYKSNQMGGFTGYSVWKSTFFLLEFILSKELIQWYAIVQGFARLCGLNAHEAQKNIIRDASGVIKPSRWNIAINFITYLKYQ